MVDNVALAQGLVGGILLARAEKAPKAGMRAGLLMGVAGGLGPMGLVLAQAAIRSQRRADLARAAANQPPPGKGDGTKPGTAIVTTPPAGGSDTGQQPATPAPPPLSVDDLKAALTEPTTALKDLGNLVGQLGEQTKAQVGVLRDLKELLARTPPPADPPAKPGK